MASRKWWISRTVAERTFWYGSNGSAETAICRPSWGEYQQTLMRKRCILHHPRQVTVGKHKAANAFPVAGWFDPMGATLPSRWEKASLFIATPRFRSGHCQRTLPVGSSREAGRWVGPRKVNVWRLPSAPPVVLPDRRGPRGGLCRCGGAAKRARASDENFQPRFRHATGPAPPPSLIPGAHQVPVRAMRRLCERRKGRG